MRGERVGDHLWQRHVADLVPFRRGEHQFRSDDADLPPHMHDPAQEVHIADGQAEDLPLPQPEPRAQVHQHLPAAGQRRAHHRHLLGRP